MGRFFTVIRKSGHAIRTVRVVTFTHYCIISIFISMEDKDRISEIMRHKGMVAKNFCEATGISPASLSHILNGKAKASLPVLRSIVDAFPELNPLWVLLGKGEMLSNPDDYVGDEDDENGQDSDSMDSDINDNPSLFSADSRTGTVNANVRPGELLFDFSDPQTSKPSPARTPQKTRTEPPVQPVQEVVKIIEKKPRKIVEIRIFYDDGTYETFS